ncbi:MAG: response regulator transcription factor, partial [Owenweeksia sp.]
MNQEKQEILLVEDDPNFGAVLRDYLELHDFKVVLAKDGVEGLQAYRNNDPEICILDVMMPHKDGFTLAGEIRDLDNEMPIIFLTAKSLKEDVLKGYQVGADDYLTKPFDSEVLLYKIKAILNRRS